MKVSELIRALQSQLNIHGDLPVVIDVDTDDEKPFYAPKKISMSAIYFSVQEDDDDNDPDYHIDDDVNVIRIDTINLEINQE